VGYYRAGGPADWDLSGAQGAAAGRGLATWLYGAQWRDEGPFMPPSYTGSKQEEPMGYYRAGGGVMANEPAYDPGAAFRNFLSAGGSSAPTYDAVNRGGAPGSDSNPSGRRRRTQVINLTALRRAERRIEKAARVAHRLFSFKKQGVHGLKLKHKRRKAS
jgi:hypothetical protein